MSYKISLLCLLLSLNALAAENSPSSCSSSECEDSKSKSEFPRFSYDGYMLGQGKNFEYDRDDSTSIYAYIVPKRKIRLEANQTKNLNDSVVISTNSKSIKAANLVVDNAYIVEFIRAKSVEYHYGYQLQKEVILKILAKDNRILRFIKIEFGSNKGVTIRALREKLWPEFDLKIANVKDPEHSNEEEGDEIL